MLCPVELRAPKKVAGEQGFEPRYYGPEPHVLPLDDSPNLYSDCKFINYQAKSQLFFGALHNDLQAQYNDAPIQSQ